MIMRVSAERSIMDDEKIIDETVETTEETAETVEEIAEETAETVEEIAEETAEAVEEIAGYAEDFAENVEADSETGEENSEAADKAVNDPYADLQAETVPPVSKKTTVILVSIILVLVAVIAVLGIMIVKNYRKNNPVESAKNNTGSDNTAVTTAPTAVPQAVDYKVTVELGQYIGVEAKAVPEEITDEAVQDEIEYYLNDYAEEIAITDRPIQEGDVVNIDYTGYLNDVPFDGGADTGYDLEIGSHSFIDGFESGLIGHNLGETVDLDVTFPENYGVESLNGQPVVFVVVINSITAYDYPELTDEFVQENFDCDTVEEYRASVREELEAYAMEEAEEQAKNEVFEKIVESSTFGGDIDAEIADYVEQTKAYYDQVAGAYYGVDGVTLFMAMYGITEDEYEEMLIEETSYSVKYGHVLDKIAEVENLQITDEEYEAEFEEMFFDYYGFTSKEEVLQELSQEQIDEMITGTAKREKAEAFVIGNAKIIK